MYDCEWSTATTMDVTNAGWVAEPGETVLDEAPASNTKDAWSDEPLRSDEDEPPPTEVDPVIVTGVIPTEPTELFSDMVGWGMTSGLPTITLLPYVDWLTDFEGLDELALVALLMDPSDPNYAQALAAAQGLANILAGLTPAINGDVTP